MSESEHTPGPWRVEREGDRKSEWHSIEAPLGGRYGSIADTLNRDHVISPDEDHANAHLIVAAPELLTVLDGLLARIVVDGTIWIENSLEVANVLAGAEALISRIRGVISPAPQPEPAPEPA